MQKETSAEKDPKTAAPDDEHQEETEKKKKDPAKESFREISKLGIKVMTLMAAMLFFIQMMTGIFWQVALMRSVTAYVLLLILYYLTLLFITIIKRNNPEKNNNGATQSR